MIDLSKYTIEELIGLKNEVSDLIYNYEDGYLYICNVRSYGRNWRDRSIKNTHTLQELCYQYNGDDGIVDVYSTNPNLEIQNYGDLMYIKSEEDYNKWREYEDLKRIIPDYEKTLEEWENRENVPFNQRPFFKPGFDMDYVNELKKELENFDMSFTPPKRFVNVE